MKKKPCTQQRKVLIVACLSAQAWQISRKALSRRRFLAARETLSRKNLKHRLVEGGCAWVCLGVFASFVHHVKGALEFHIFKTYYYL